MAHKIKDKGPLQLDPKAFRQMLAHWEAALRQGQSAQVYKNIRDLLNSKTIDPSHLRSEERAMLIHYLRRSGAALEAVRLGGPTVRGPAAEQNTPSKAERIEYAAALIFAGLNREGLSVLMDMRGPKPPLAKLYMAFSHFPEWEYQKAKPLLFEYLEQTSSEDYFWLVAKLNLAACHVFLGELDQAEPLLLEIIASAKKDLRTLVLANALELSAQVYLEKKDLVSAEQALGEAFRQSSDDESVYTLYLKKWRYVLNLQKGQATEDEFHGLVALAKQLQNFETVRDLFLRRALAKNDVNLLQLISAGTPYSAYREYIARKSGTRKFVNQITLQPGKLFDSALTTLQQPPSDERTSPELKIASHEYRSHRLLYTLFSDHFSPWTPQKLFQSVFANRYYEERSAKNLLHQSIFELRRELTQSKKGIRVVWQNGFIYIELEQALTIDLRAFESIPRAESVMEFRASSLLAEIQKIFSSKSFQIQDLEKHLSIPRRTLQRQLSSLVAKGLLQTEGQRKSRRYKIDR